MADVPLPKVDHDAGWHRQYTADQMHAHAAAVSAAKDTEIERLRAEAAGLREDAERWRWLREKQAYIGIHPHHKELPIEQRSGWTIRLVPDVKNSFDASIDAARKGEA